MKRVDPLAARFALRGILLVLAVAHSLPARKHLALFFAEPSWTEAWKGFGAALAVGLYLLPVRTYARALASAWAHHRALLIGVGWLLAIVHAVPAADHLPKLATAATWGEAWRGGGAALACAWFVAPVRVQAAAFGALRTSLGYVVITPVERPVRQLNFVTVIACGLLFGSIAGAGLLREHTAAPPAAAETVAVPRAAGPIELDGELEDPGWAGGVARTGPFVSAGAPARPYSDARFTYGDGQLYVMLYAADEDIRVTSAKHDEPLSAGDSFQLVFHTASGDKLIDVSPDGIVSDGARTRTGSAVDYRWESHAITAHDQDGTPNDPSDQDEEWVIEMAIPLSSLGLTGAPGERVGVSIRRCDHLRDGRSCAGWGEANAPKVLVLGESARQAPNVERGISQ
jgi:hypothetical protein